MLDVTKAYRHLGWRSQWGVAQTVKETVSWYVQVSAQPASALQLVEQQTATYFNEGA
jgi:dTDP-D-glucose 4,6-dehydratase